jgi:hypothetical protein
MPEAENVIFKNKEFVERLFVWDKICMFKSDVQNTYPFKIL